MFKQLFYEANGGGGAGAQGKQDPPAANALPADWDAYLTSLPEAQRAHVEKLYTEKNQGLLNSVKATRDERDGFAKDLRDAAKKLEKGSDAEKQLTTQATQLEEANRRASFMEDALSHECKNPKVAYAVATSQDLFNKAGVPDWKAIQEAAPELFGKLAPRGKGGAGAGTGDGPPPAGDMNSWIRQQAGIRTTQE